MFFKVLFSYAEFVELFNWEKTGNRPCGLLNCGNRFVLKSKVKYQYYFPQAFIIYIIYYIIYIIYGCICLLD